MDRGMISKETLKFLNRSGRRIRWPLDEAS